MDTAAAAAARGTTGRRSWRGGFARQAGVGSDGASRTPWPCRTLPRALHEVLFGVKPHPRAKNQCRKICHRCCSMFDGSRDTSQSGPGAMDRGIHAGGSPLCQPNVGKTRASRRVLAAPHQRRHDCVTRTRSACHPFCSTSSSFYRRNSAPLLPPPSLQPLPPPFPRHGSPILLLLALRHAPVWR